MGTNPITLTVTAEDATTTKMYTVTVTREAPPGTSTDATLGALSLSAGTLSPTFDMATTSYTASVGNTVDEVTVTATASHSSATVAHDPVNPVELCTEGANPITVTVTAGDGTTMKDVYRHGDARGGGSWVERRGSEWPEPERRHADPSVQRGHYIVHGQCGDRYFNGYGHGDGE